METETKYIICKTKDWCGLFLSNEAMEQKVKGKRECKCFRSYEEAKEYLFKQFPDGLEGFRVNRLYQYHTTRYCVIVSDKTLYMGDDFDIESIYRGMEGDIRHQYFDLQRKDAQSLAHSILQSRRKNSAPIVLENRIVHF